MSATSSACVFHSTINRSFQNLSKSQLFVLGISCGFVCSRIQQAYHEGIEALPFGSFLLFAFQATRRAVWKQLIQLSLKGKEAPKFEFPAIPKDFCESSTDMKTGFTTLPDKGLSATQIIERAGRYKTLNRRWDEGYFSGCVYLATKELTSLINEVCSMYQWTNPLHLDLFLGVRWMEIQIITMVIDLYRGDPQETCGVVTLGGTESILLAMKTYRDMARKQRGIRYPEIIVPMSGHPAWDKGAQYFGIRLRKARIFLETGRVDINHVKELANNNTICIVGSAPSYPYGAIDDITALAAIAESWSAGCHVDACLGSFLVPFLRDDLENRTGIRFDFSVKGVTSISCDTHKYGGAPKGSSVLLYRSREIRHHQTFAISTWTGGSYFSPTTCGSRPGNIIAGTWAALMYFGREGYRNNAHKISQVARAFSDLVTSIPELERIGSLDAATVSFFVRKEHRKQVDIFRFFQMMKTKGWEMVPLQFPSALMMTFTLLHTDPSVYKRLERDVLDVMQCIRETPGTTTGHFAIYGSSQFISDRSLVDEFLITIVDSYFTPNIEQDDDKRGQTS